MSGGWCISASMILRWLGMQALVQLNTLSTETSSLTLETAVTVLAYKVIYCSSANRCLLRLLWLPSIVGLGGASTSRTQRSGMLASRGTRRCL